MSKYIVDIHGDIEGDYEIVRKYEDQEPILDKLKAEIKAMFPQSGSWMYDEDPERCNVVCEVLADVMQIIDKYMAESEDNK